MQSPVFAGHGANPLADMLAIGKQDLEEEMQHFKIRGTSLAVALTLCTALMSVAFAASPAPAEGENGMVVTAQHLASEVGVEVMKKGGNAVDAAVAVGYALAVVYPTAGNIGGGGFMTIRLKDGKTTFLDFRERAPLAATKTMYLDKDGNPIKGASTDGYLAVGVPGSVAGFEMAREKYGIASRARICSRRPSAGQGRLRARPGRRRPLRRRQRQLSQDTAAAQIFLKDGKPFDGRNPGSARPRAIARGDLGKGPDAFYKGAIADTSSRRAPPTAASWRRRTSSNIRCASWSR